jgi:hypothetical protein
MWCRFSPEGDPAMAVKAKKATYKGKRTPAKKATPRGKGGAKKSNAWRAYTGDGVRSNEPIPW